MNDLSAFLLFVFGVLLGILVVALIILSNTNNTYMDGQIDCLNNQIYYELQKQDDGTTEWIYVPEGVK